MAATAGEAATAAGEAVAVAGEAVGAGEADAGKQPSVSSVQRRAKNL